jgi:hypothetical protein
VALDVLRVTRKEKAGFVVGSFLLPMEHALQGRKLLRLILAPDNVAFEEQ